MANLKTGKRILEVLNSAGYEAFFVGGCVRDYLLGINAVDIDVTTNARPEEVEALFERTIPTGKAFGTITVLYDAASFEVTTYREAEIYDNHRHPRDLRFGSSLREDCARRDFTINQIAMDKDLKIYDTFHGQQDLKKRKVKAIGEASKRFEEDALRMLRAFRFAAQLNFTIEEKTLLGIKEKAYLIKAVAIERIQQELFKLLNAKHKSYAITQMINTNFLEALYDLKVPFKVLENARVTYDYIEALTVLMLEEKDVLSLFKLSRKEQQEIKKIYNLVLATKNQPFSSALLFSEGLDIALKANTVHQLYGRDDQRDAIRQLEQNLTIRNVCDLAFKGEDIVREFTIKKPYHTRFILDTLILKVLQNDIKNTREALKEEAKRILDKLEKSEH